MVFAGSEEVDDIRFSSDSGNTYNHSTKRRLFQFVFWSLHEEILLNLFSNIFRQFSSFIFVFMFLF